MSDQYSEWCDSIYKQIYHRLEQKDDDRLRFAPRDTAENVLHDDNLRGFFRSLPGASSRLHAVGHVAAEDMFVARMKENKLHGVLAVLIFATCSPAAAEAFANHVVGLAQSDGGQHTLNLSLPASAERLLELFQDEVQVDKFRSRQACFCPIVLEKRKEVRVDNLNDWRLPYLAVSELAEGSFGKVFKVRIARGQFYKNSPAGVAAYNDEAFDVARKDYRTSPHFPARDEREIMEKILQSSSYRCDNIVESLGSLEIGDRYSLFMPLAICDLKVYMTEYHRPAPNSAEAKMNLIRCAEGLSRGVHFLHSELQTPNMEKLVCYHMDLTPNNVLIFPSHDRTGHVWKLSDFGMARVKLIRTSETEGRERDFNSFFVRAEKKSNPSQSGTQNRRGDNTYLAPESISSRKDMTTKSDVWSLGCVISVLFAYLEDGGHGIDAFEKARLRHDSIARFFVDRRSFQPIKLNPAVEKWHGHLVKKACSRSDKEGEAVKRILAFLVDRAFQIDRGKRCKADEVRSGLEDAFRAYHGFIQSSNDPSRPPIFGIPRINMSRKEENTGVPNVQSWTILSQEAFKGCAISPKASLVTYWTDEKILLFSSVSLTTNQDHLISQPSSTYTLESAGFWRSIDLSEEYLIGCVTGNDQCYVFDLFGLSETTLNDCTKISLDVAEVIAVAISPNSREIACAVRRWATDTAASILHTSRDALLNSGRRPSDTSRRRLIDTDWAASGIIHLTISDSCDVHIVIRPDLAMRPDEHTIPICCISFGKRTMHTITLESKGYDSSGHRRFYTSFAPLSDSTCAVITRQKRLHLLQFGATGNDQDTQRDITNYRLLQLLVDQRNGDNNLYALGTTAASRKVLVLALSDPRVGKTITIREVGQLPDLAYGAEFAARLSSEDGELCVLVAALVGSSRRIMFRVTLGRV